MFRNPLAGRLALVALLVVAYFVLFPQDLASLINPLEQLLRISQIISPWLYGVAGVIIVCWTVRSVWSDSRRPTNRLE